MIKLNSKLVALSLAILISGGVSLDASISSAMTRTATGLQDSTAMARSPRTDQAPDDDYDLTQFSRDIQGTPCGVNCTRDKEMRLNRIPLR